MKLYEVINGARNVRIMDRLGREVKDLPKELLMHIEVLGYCFNPYQNILEVAVDYMEPTCDPSVTPQITRIIHYLETLFNKSSEEQAALLNQAIRNLEEYIHDTRAN